jgi:cytoskeletal protein CcmA (bactofilin family)
MSAGEADGYIGPDLHYRGKLLGRGDVRIEGRFDGDIDISGVLTIGAFADVRAAIKAVSVSVAGKIIGNVEATTLVEVHAGGLIDGDVNAPHVTVDHGGKIVGSDRSIDLDSKIAMEPSEPGFPVIGRVTARYRSNK